MVFPNYSYLYKASFGAVLIYFIIIKMKCEIVLRLFFGLFLIVAVKCKIYSRCSLAIELYEVHGVSLQDIPTLVCLAKHVSDYNTALHNGKQNGLFGFAQDYWCAEDSYSKGCQLICSDFRDDSISDDVTCFKQVLRTHQKSEGNGFKAWGKYYADTCVDQNMTLSYIEGCFPKECKFYSI